MSIGFAIGIILGVALFGVLRIAIEELIWRLRYRRTRR